jgi:hypothetical protein
MASNKNHRHLRKIDWLMTRTTRPAAKKELKCGANSSHTTKLEQSISLDIYDKNTFKCVHTHTHTHTHTTHTHTHTQ